jgi:tetratricopeptide (TPR) repeat protein
MKTKHTRTAIITIIGLLVLAGVVGYFLGTMSSVKKPNENTRPSSGPAPAPQPSVDYAEILGGLLSRLKDNPNDAALQARVGDLYFDMKSYDDSLPYYQKAIELDPNDIDSHNDLGLALHYLGRSNEAIEYIDKGINVNPDFQRIYLTKGFVLAQGLGNLKEARAAWGKAISIDPDNEIAKSAMQFLSNFKDTK